MKKLLATTLAITAVLFASAASAQSVRGESLDSGLGALPANYTAGEYNYAKKADGSIEWPFAM
jgi:hypothetical protein